SAPQQNFGPFPFQATPQPNNGFVMPAPNSTMGGSRTVIGGSQVPPVFFTGTAHVQQGLSSGYDPFNRQVLGHTYEGPGYTQQVSSQATQQTFQQPAGFPQVSRQDSGTSQMSSKFAKFPE
ncbi:hypothetical protein EC988_009246, partial [Linderina pennispora]